MCVFLVEASTKQKLFRKYVNQRAHHLASKHNIVTRMCIKTPTLIVFSGLFSQSLLASPPHSPG